jgi:hypothetical protein
MVSCAVCTVRFVAKVAKAGRPIKQGLSVRSIIHSQFTSWIFHRLRMGCRTFIIFVSSIRFYTIAPCWWKSFGFRLNLDLMNSLKLTPPVRSLTAVMCSLPFFWVRWLASHVDCSVKRKAKYKYENNPALNDHSPCDRDHWLSLHVQEQQEHFQQISERWVLSESYPYIERAWLEVKRSSTT